MSCSFKCHCGNDLCDDRETRRGYCSDCDGRHHECTNCKVPEPPKPSPKAQETLSHPCKQTCSGWKQGFEEGRSKAFIEAVDEVEMIVGESDGHGISTKEVWDKAAKIRAMGRPK